MKELFEDKMNDKFRKELVNYHVPYDQQAWERLSKDLQAKPVSRWRKWKLSAGWGFGIAVAGLIIYYAYLSTIDPLGIKQLQHNTTSTIAKREHAQSSNSTTGHSIDFNKKIQPGSEVSVPNGPTERRFVTQEVLIQRKDSKHIDNESRIPVSKEPDVQVTEFLVAKTGMLKSPEIKVKLKELREKNTRRPEIKRQKLKLPKLNIGFSGDHYSRFVGPNKLSLFYNPEFDLEKTLRNPGLVHGLGIEFEGPINSTINLAIGVSYFSKQYSGSETFRLDSSKISGLHVPFVDSTITRTGSYQFLEMPVTLRLSLYSGQRSSLFFNAGFSLIAFLNQEYNTHTVVNQEETDTNIKQKAWKNIYPVGSLNFGLTYRYALSDRFSIGTSVEYKNHLPGLGAFPLELNRVSGEIGIMYRFGRKDDN